MEANRSKNLLYENVQQIMDIEPGFLAALEELLDSIIEALASGGSFYYAPGLPFVEDHLAPERYKVEREQPRGGLFVSIVTKI